MGLRKYSYYHECGDLLISAIVLTRSHKLVNRKYIYRHLDKRSCMHICFQKPNQTENLSTIYHIMHDLRCFPEPNLYNTEVTLGFNITKFNHIIKSVVLCIA